LRSRSLLRSEPETIVDGKRAPSVVWVTIKATEDDLHTINTALVALRRITNPEQRRIKVEIETRSDDGEIDQIAFQNNVRQRSINENWLALTGLNE
jgi:hypothetical protein